VRERERERERERKERVYYIIFMRTRLIMLFASRKVAFIGW
jgi:hypothetical protein